MTVANFGHGRRHRRYTVGEVECRVSVAGMVASSRETATSEEHPGAISRSRDISTRVALVDAPPIPAGSPLFDDPATKVADDDLRG
jgi:hypothetical protein